LTGLLLALFAVQLKAQTAVESWGQLRVSGPNIVNQDGEKVQLQGMSLFWSQWQPSFYEYNTIKWLRDDWCVNIIRPACGVEDNGNPYNGLDYQLNKARAVIDAAIDLNIYVLVDWHAHYAPRNIEAAKSFFKTIAQEYGSYPNVIYEPFNEPLGYDWNAIKAYHETIISEIRKYDPDNIIVCGTPQWSSYPDAPIGNAINQPNIAYTLHYYAASHFQDFRDRANAARNNGLCVFVTEYGLVNADGGGNVNEASSRDWWNWMNTNKISHCNWSLGNKAEGASALTPGTPAGGFWTSSQLTWSGGLVRGNLTTNCPNYPVKVKVVTKVPGKIEAETYSKMLGIQKETTTDIGGGQNIGYLDANDWIEYEINAIGDGSYGFSYRLASAAGGQFKLFVDGVEKHSIIVPATGDWQKWIDLEKIFDLKAGLHTIKILVITGGWNLNYINVTASGLKDCNGDVNGTASIDNCGVCSGGNTGKAINACEGGCLSGYGTKGVKDDFMLEKEPFTNQGTGVFVWGEKLLAGDDNPKFQSVFTRNFSEQKLNVVLSQGQGEYVPFGFSFGDKPTKTIDLSGNATFELSLENTSTQNFNISLAIQDVNGKLINTYALAKGQNFSDAWKYAVSATINKGAKYVFKGDFKGGYFANYTTKSFETNFDFTKVAAILITVTNSTNTGVPNYLPLSLNNLNFSIKDIRLGDCSATSNDNNKDCNGDINGGASIDKCGVCSGGKTNVLPDNCDITSTDNQQFDQKFNVYPNPVQNSLNLTQSLDWMILSQTGLLVKKGSGDLINVEDVSKGLYFLQTSLGTVKFIKE
jgi:endoglucanase